MRKLFLMLFTIAAVAGNITVQGDNIYIGTKITTGKPSLYDLSEITVDDIHQAADPELSE